MTLNCVMRKLTLLFCLGICCMSAAQAQETPSQDSIAQQYVGKYKFPDGSVVADVVVTFENGALSMSSSAGVSPLEKQSTADMFTITQFQGTARFNRDSNKKVVGVSIVAMGYELEGTKVENAALTDNRKSFYPYAVSFVLARVY